MKYINISVIKYSLFLLCMYSFSEVNAWEALFYRYKTTKILYDIQKDTKFKKSHDFFFPEELRYTDLNYDKGYQILNYKKLDSNIASSLNIIPTKKYYFNKKFNESISINSKDTWLTISCYLKNIQEYDLFICINNTWVKKKIHCYFDGYQYINSINLQDLLVSGKNYLQEKIDQIVIIATPKNYKEDILFAPNIFKIEEKILEANQCQHLFLNKLFRKEKNTEIIFNNNALSSVPGIEDPWIVSNRGIYDEYEVFDSSFSFVNTAKDEESEIYLIIRTIRLALEDYLFYEEKKLDKKLILDGFEQIVNEFYLHNDSDLLLSNLTSFIHSEMRDGHFVLYPANMNREHMFSPIRLYEFRNKVKVTAIFDSTYTKDIRVGSEIIKIDDIPINIIIDSLKEVQYGQPERQRKRAIASLLDRKNNSSVKLSFKDSENNTEKDIIVNYNYTRIKIPSNFKIAHYTFNVINEISYFKINSMDGNVFLRFINHIDEIQNSKGLIIDLRGNGGGSSSDSYQLFSLFINKPTIFSHTEYAKNKTKMESIIIQPHKRFNISPNFPIFILGDENTACSSEGFIEAMKQLENCSFLSYSRTAGSLHNRYTISFPSGHQLSLDCLSDKIYSPNMQLIEDIGVEPDIWIQPRDVNDLAPYDDLLKKAALKLITVGYAKQSIF